MPSSTTAPMSNSMLVPSSLDTKDERDFSRSRQLRLKPSDRARAKRCVRCKCCKPWKWNGNAGDARKIRPSLAGDFAVSGNSSDEDTLDAVYSTPRRGAEYFSSPAPVEVPFADLVKPAKQRGGIAGTFEFIPRVRAVVPLQDWDEEKTSEDDCLDAEWEHIESLTDRKSKRAAKRQALAAKPRSYAAVVVKKA